MGVDIMVKRGIPEGKSASDLEKLLASVAAFCLALGFGDLPKAGCRFAPSLIARLLVMFVGAGFFQNPALHSNLLELPQGRINVLAWLHMHLCQMSLIPFAK